MALLNKLFFPSASPATSTAPPPSVVASALSSASTQAAGATLTSANQHHQQQTVNSATTQTATAATLIGSQTTTTTAGVKASATTQQTSRNYLSHFPFEGSQVRILLYKDGDSRRLLFDSHALQKVIHKDSSSSTSSSKFLKNDKYSSTTSSQQNGKIQAKAAAAAAHSNQNNSNNYIEVCPEYGYKHNRPNGTDITPLGEMVFGSLPMSFCGTALKVHWLAKPSRILCSQVFLTPTASNGVGGAGVGGTSAGHSPYSTLSMNSLATPRSSICSELGSMDGLSMNSFSMPFSVSVGRQMSLTPPLDVPSLDQQSLSINSSSQDSSSGPRYSSTYSNATDSGYSANASGDQWSYQYSSTRSSLGSVLSSSDQSQSAADAMRKLSMDSAVYYATGSPHLDEFASDGCLQRRISRNLRTSFENEHSKNDFIGFLSDNYGPSGVGGGGNGGGSEGSSMAPPQYRRASYSANESRSNPEIGRRQANLRRRAKLGLAVCITMSESFEEEMELFCSEHIALLESMLSRLRASTEHAYINHKNFLQIMFQAWQDTQQWFNDLFTAPRIKTPVWLSITTSGSKYSKTVAERFIKELCDLLAFADTKDSNFFISTMLTGILTYHLGWVATVSAFNSSSSRRSAASSAAIERRAKLLQVSQKHPYNALWAQLGDLYGAIGMPTKLARTIIYGTEKLWVEKLLNVLTYFIRCSEVRRAAKREDFNKEIINELVNQSQNQERQHKSSPSQLRRTGGGLSRTATCKQNLNAIVDDADDDELRSCCGPEDEVEDDELLHRQNSLEDTVDSDGMQTLKKNEIPTVLAFRDSHFVQQELRIGNYLMDTGIEKKTLLARQAQQYFRTGKDGRIRLTVTTPDNVEMCMEDESNGTGSVGTGGSIDDNAIEALEFDDVAEPPPTTGKKSFFWNMGAGVKEGLSLSDLMKLQQGVKIINRKMDRRCSSFSVDGNPPSPHKLGDGKGGIVGIGEFEALTSERRASHLSLSDLITQNSMGKSGRMTWGIEPIKENVSLEEQIHFDLCHKLIEREHGICRQTSSTDNGNGVVFVLGENEPLINIKKSNEDLSEHEVKHPPSLPMLCALHQRTHDNAKKHSGMKFNFEQYPQIATNYMKSKNLHMSNYDLLMDKATKLEASEAAALKTSDSAVTLQHPDLATSSSSSMPTLAGTPAAALTTSERCVVCSSGGLSSGGTYQTPSNATELEFETDDMHCHNPQSSNSSGSKMLQPVNSAASIDTLKSAPEPQVANTTTTVSTNISNSNVQPNYLRKQQPKRVPSGRSSVSSVAAKCAAVNEAQQLLKLPVPGIKELPQEDEPPGDQVRAGFIPSLMLSVSDHYVSDMVLQGTCAPPNKWETNLRDDLALAARSASLISQPAENIAIVADMDKCDVRLISSQAQQFPYAGGQSEPVGMSQLVSSMLETVQAMHAGGIPPYECLSYLESKLQEIYLHSETLAAFLLETDHCRLSDITKSLQLSENDVPLLLSIAFIHTPKISRKCGISFR
ncbi:LOW QUALITY PROTEIN: folliculin-interacting protein 1 [Drosophila tropicalis]|uniref:LOW QUALITY PROTEIN: folliculin-interacting protein 1 n=1 Tax=Drosophila tropicalis TaxID=46794 RepID=UPI0035ABBBC1